MTTPTPHGAMPEPLHPASAIGNGFTADQMREYARAAIQQAAGAVPEGWRLVPVERASISDAPKILNANDKAFWVIGWNECVAAIAASGKGGV